MEVTGKLIQHLDYKIGKSKDGKEWKKQDFLLETNEKYNNLYFFSLFGSEAVTEFLHKYKIGDDIMVKFNVKTNDHNGKYYTNLIAWKVLPAN